MQELQNGIPESNENKATPILPKEMRTGLPIGFLYENGLQAQSRAQGTEASLGQKGETVMQATQLKGVQSAFDAKNFHAFMQISTGPVDPRKSGVHRESNFFRFTSVEQNLVPISADSWSQAHLHVCLSCPFYILNPSTPWEHKVEFLSCSAEGHSNSIEDIG